ncbi:MAG: GNAT family N-acetyltransferase [Armatimonadetes bacterium]|nr:GNAT family N-acetyltransferase [Armatimonadota bacterium]
MDGVIMGGVEIRRATVRDIPDILPVWGELADFHTSLDASFRPSSEWKHEYADYLRSLMMRDDALALLARVDGEVVGYGVARVSYLPGFFLYRRRGYIHDVYTRQGFRRHGIGRQMVQGLLDWLRDRGVSLVELTVAVNNDEAVAFWKALGFATFMHHMKREFCPRIATVRFLSRPDGFMWRIPRGARPGSPSGRVPAPRSSGGSRDAFARAAGYRPYPVCRPASRR